MKNEFLRQKILREMEKMNQAFIGIDELLTEKYDHSSFEEFHLLAARMFIDAAYRARKVVDIYKGRPS